MRNSTSTVIQIKEKARMNYDRLSRWYDCIAGSSEAMFRQRGIQELAPSPGEYILEIGSGTGHGLVDIGSLVGERGWVVGIDISDGMVREAIKRLSQNRVRDWIGLCIGDGAYLPFQANSFDAILICFTLELFDALEIPQVLSQCLRVLTPNGRLVIISLMKVPSPSLADRLYEWVHARMPVLIDCRPIHVEPILAEIGFDISSKIYGSLWGLHVAIIAAIAP